MPDETEEEQVDAFVKEGTSYRERQAKAKLKEYRGRRGQERLLHARWKEQGQPEELGEQLLDSLAPIINREAKRRAAGLAGSVSMPALRNELRTHAFHGLQTYDPNFVSPKSGRKTQLSTHITQQFMRVTDFVAQNRNTVAVPRPKVERYGELKNAIGAYETEFGREPSDHDLREMLPLWKPGLIKELRHSFRPEAFSGMSAPLTGDTSQAEPTRAAYLMVRMTMTQQEKDFAERHFPPEGKRQMSVRAIAKALGVPEHKAYRIKARVEKKIKPVYKGR